MRVNRQWERIRMRRNPSRVSDESNEACVLSSGIFFFFCSSIQLPWIVFIFILISCILPSLAPVVVVVQKKKVSLTSLSLKGQGRRKKQRMNVCKIYSRSSLCKHVYMKGGTVCLGLSPSHRRVRFI